VCAWIALRHAQETADAAAMRWLLVLTGSALIGETLAAYLLI
jgi:hypothetical protein